MSETTRLRIELNNLKNQVKYLIAKDSGASGGVPVKIIGPYANYPSDVFEVGVYEQGLGNPQTRVSSALRVLVTPEGEEPDDIEAGTLFFATPAKNENFDGDTIEFYIQESVAGSSTAPAKILSKVSDYTYNVLLYPDGLLATETETTCEQLGINAGQTIPANTWTLATQASDGSWYMQVPVWL